MPVRVLYYPTLSGTFDNRGWYLSLIGCQVSDLWCIMSRIIFQWPSPKIWWFINWVNLLTPKRDLLTSKLYFSLLPLWLLVCLAPDGLMEAIRWSKSTGSVAFAQDQREGRQERGRHEMKSRGMGGLKRPRRRTWRLRAGSRRIKTSRRIKN